MSLKENIEFGDDSRNEAAEKTKVVGKAEQSVLTDDGPVDQAVDESCQVVLSHLDSIGILKEKDSK